MSYAEANSLSMGSLTDVLIVCGQGTYLGGRFWSEHADSDVYIEHAVGVSRLVEVYKYKHVVCSGGSTQSGCRTITEAESFLNIWQDTESIPGVPVILEDQALDSVENLLLGLLAFKIHHPTLVVRRIGVSTAWQFKKRRFLLIAAAMGIEQQLYFHAIANESRALAGNDASIGEGRNLDAMQSSSDYLMLGEEWENKRLIRFTGPPSEVGHASRLVQYDDRVLQYRQNPRYVGLFAQIDKIRGLLARHEVPEYSALRGEIQNVLRH